MIATVLAYLTMPALLGVAGKLWRGFCGFIATPVGAALVAALIGYGVGKAIEYKKVTAAWELKWSTAEAEAERQRLARDAFIKAKTQADADARLKELSDSKSALEEKLKSYEEADAKAPTAAGDSVTDSRDDDWLRDAKRAYAKPKARR